MDKATTKLISNITDIIKEIGETEKECSIGTLCTACKWNRKLRRILRSCLLRIK